MTCRREAEEEVRSADDDGSYDEVSRGGLVALLGLSRKWMVEAMGVESV